MPATEPSAAAAERARLADAVVHVVAEHGYAETSLKLVLARAEADPAAFRRHFKSLEDACCLAYEDLSLQFAQGMVAAFVEAEAGSWVEQIQAAGVALYRYVTADLERARFIYVEFPLISRRSRALRDRTMRSLITLLDQGRQQLDDPDSMSRATAEAVAGAMYDRLRDSVRADDPLLAAPKVASELAYMAIQPYLGPEAATAAMDLPID